MDEHCIRTSYTLHRKACIELARFGPHARGSQVGSREKDRRRLEDSFANVRHLRRRGFLVKCACLSSRCQASCFSGFGASGTSAIHVTPVDQGIQTLFLFLLCFDDFLLWSFKFLSKVSISYYLRFLTLVIPFLMQTLASSGEKFADMAGLVKRVGELHKEHQRKQKR